MKKVKKIIGLLLTGIVGWVYTPLLMWSLDDIFGYPKGKDYDLGSERNFYRGFGVVLLLICVIFVTTTKYIVYRYLYDWDKRMIVLDIMLFCMVSMLFFIMSIFFKW